MPRPYSNDLRQKVVLTVENGASRRQAAKLFKVSVSFVIKLLQRVQATGEVSPAQFGGYKTSPLKTHEADLRRWVAERSDITIVQHLPFTHRHDLALVRLFLGGTSLLIVVNVTVDTISQVQSHL